MHHYTKVAVAQNTDVVEEKAVVAPVAAAVAVAAQQADTIQAPEKLLDVDEMPVAGNVDDARRCLFDTVMDVAGSYWRVCYVALIDFIDFIAEADYTLLHSLVNAVVKSVRSVIVALRDGCLSILRPRPHPHPRNVDNAWSFLFDTIRDIAGGYWRVFYVALGVTLGVTLRVAWRLQRFRRAAIAKARLANVRL